MAEEKEIMRIEDVAEYLNCSPGTVYRLIKKSGLPTTKIANKYMFRRDLVDKWFEDKVREQLENEAKK